MVRMWVQLKRLCVLCVRVLQSRIVVMDVIWRRLCVGMIQYDLPVIYLFRDGQGCDE